MWSTHAELSHICVHMNKEMWRWLVSMNIGSLCQNKIETWPLRIAKEKSILSAVISSYVLSNSSKDGLYKNHWNSILLYIFLELDLHSSADLHSYWICQIKVAVNECEMRARDRVRIIETDRTLNELPAYPSVISCLNNVF